MVVFDLAHRVRSLFSVMRTIIVVILAFVVLVSTACVERCSTTTLEALAEHPNCTDAIVLLRDYVSTPGPHDWRALDSLVLIGHNATILGNRNRVSSKRFVAENIMFSGATNTGPFLIPSRKEGSLPEVFIVKNCEFDGAYGVSLAADENTISLFANIK